ncbi:MAG: group II intron reverse transcriptase/maturase, partial [Clostridium sp.]|uniref:group II intron reverse transcriptase/maturase n=1 Tax=Clostridium sp. TaxID=1506 RepID=UPI003EE7564F
MNVTKEGIKYRQLQIEDYLQMVSAEQKEYAEVYASSRITENNITNTDVSRDDLLEKILGRDNLNQAYERVKSNKGAGGIDGMGVEHLLPYLKENNKLLIQKVKDGKYRPNPVRRVEIPKEEKGKVRKLGIPTVVDRVIQQAIAQVLTPIFEKQFSDNSYGFRPRRKAHDAMTKCIENADEGYKYVVDMDLEKYFDTVNQSKLIEILSRTIKDGRVISLIHKFLKAGVVEKHTFKETGVGVPQGGPLSPLLSNIMLNELDQELERRGHKFVRYADDLMILCKSKKSARRTLEKIVPFIENKLFLKVNHDKTEVAYIGKVKFLG